MASGAKQLVDDFEQVKKLIESYPNIKIINTEGDPPEQYDIEYTIKGYKTNPDGTASPDNKHQVRINLPFGYPHFPPTAKPLTPIFHPDIDPDAIRIADFWQEKNSLSELIIHIGQMICGNHYTKEEPFNQNAFEWFQERQSWLPFDILEPGDEDETSGVTDSETAELEEGEAKKAAPAKDLDILKDDIDFPFAEDESEDAEDEFSFDIGEETADSDETASETDAIPDFDIGELSQDSFDLGETFDPETIEEEMAEKPEIDPGDIGDDAEESTEKAAEDPGLDLHAADSDSFDLDELGNEDEDAFSLDMEDEADELSFDFADMEEEKEPEADNTDADALFDLETEAPAGQSIEDIPLEFESDDMASAFDEEQEPSGETETVDISLDDLAGLEQEDATPEPLLTDEPAETSVPSTGKDETIDVDDEASIDLSGLEGEDTGEETPVPEDAEDEEEKILSALSLDEDTTSVSKLADQSEAIGSLIEQKKIFTAKKVLADLPDPDLLPDKAEHEHAIANAISEAEELYKTADKHEKKGEFEKAGILLDLVANIATDFPGLEQARNSIRESIMGGDKITSSAKDGEKKEEDSEEEEQLTPKKTKAKARRKFKVPVRLIIILLVFLSLGGIGAGVFYVFNNDSENADLARSLYNQAEELVKNKDFKEAKIQFDNARAALDNIIFFQGDEKKRILEHISDTTETALFKEGLQGRVLYGETYVTLEEAKAIDRFNNQKRSAEKILSSGNVDKAIAAYEQSLPFADKAGLENEHQVITRKIAELRLQKALSDAKKFKQEQDWLAAKKSYQTALEIGQDILKPDELNTMAHDLAIASYQHGLSESIQAVNNAEWQNSIDALLEVKKVLDDNPDIISTTQKTEVEKLLIQSLLYHYLAEARKAYEIGEWNQAIDTYNDAIDLLNKNIDLLGEKGSDNIRKLQKTILTTNVAKEQAEVEKTKARNELAKTVSHYRNIVELIENSTFKEDESLAEILDDARAMTIEIKNQLLIDEREKWLTENYEKIFRENYPSAKSSELMNPKVRFIKREGNLMIFNISCTELKQGRKFRLELNYQNNLDKNSWSLYSGKIDEE